MGLVGTVLLFVVHTSPELDNSNDGNAWRIISARKAKHMKGKRMRKETFKPLPPAQQAEIDALAVLPDDQINTAALPERSDWSDAKRGVFFRPIKKQLTLRLDSDLIDWFKSHASAGEGYQTRINSALREYISSAVQHST